jgi:hypothetical protein
MIVLKQQEKAFVEQSNCFLQLVVAILTANIRWFLQPNWCARSERVTSTAAVYPNIKSTFIDG